MIQKELDTINHQHLTSDLQISYRYGIKLSVLFAKGINHSPRCWTDSDDGVMTCPPQPVWQCVILSWPCSPSQFSRLFVVFCLSSEDYDYQPFPTTLVHNQILSRIILQIHSGGGRRGTHLKIKEKLKLNVGLEVKTCSYLQKKETFNQV